MRNSDLFCSGSYDGQILFYKLNKEKKNFSIVKTMDGLHGCLNNIKFSNLRTTALLQNGSAIDSLMLAVSHSKEERLGRWHVQPKVKEGITIIKKSSVGSS